jgi:hypothetical protein
MLNQSNGLVGWGIAFRGRVWLVLIRKTGVIGRDSHRHVAIDAGRKIGWHRFILRVRVWNRTNVRARIYIRIWLSHGL